MDMGSYAGIIKIAAKKLGMSLDAYLDKLKSGDKWCCQCRRWRRVGIFGKDRTRYDGRDSKCFDCRAKRRPRVGPSSAERKMNRQLGLEWCSQCKRWLPAVAVASRGYCKPCINGAKRTRYANDPVFRSTIKSFVSQRQNGVSAVPEAGEEFLLKLFDGKCAYCSKKADTWDHIHPVKRGGKTTPGNIVPCCRSCNSSKSDTDVYDWMKSKGIDPSELLWDRLTFMDAALFG